MSKIKDLSVAQLRLAISLKTKIDKLQRKLDALGGGKSSAPSGYAKQRSSDDAVPRKRRKMSAEVRARMAASAKLRWKKAKAAGKNRL